MLKYISGKDGEVFHLSSENVRARIKTAGFYDYEWEPEEIEQTIGSVLTNIGKRAARYELTVDFIGDKETRAKLADAFFEIIEKDICAKKPGRLYFKDYYLECFVYGSKFGGKDQRTRAVQKRVKAYAFYPFWIREFSINIPPSGKPNADGLVYDYVYGYPYGSNNMSVTFVNDHFTECDFKMCAHGQFEKLRFAINEHMYEVNVSCQKGERVVVDTKNKTIIKIDAKGNEKNVFGYQNFAYDNFKKMPAGSNVLSYSRTHGMDLIFYQERSEPKWRSEEKTTYRIVTEDGYYIVTEDGRYLVTE